MASGRRNLPAGSVTFLFTDIEGSTKLLQQFGDQAYAEALQEHRRALRNIFARHGGAEVDTQGDAFFVAFSTPQEAVAAAQEARDVLAAGPIRVRAGLHTGTPRLTEEGYVGQDVHKGARLAASGHGGQVLLSRETWELVQADVTDLGEHLLKDFADPVQIFQLGTEQFSPLRTISNTNLPRPASSFVGRKTDLREIVSLLRGGVRLLTLTGPGGSGKTRLAIEAAAELVPEFKAGVFWAELAPLKDPALVVEIMGQAVGAKDGLAAHIGTRELLMLLDNFEHVAEAASELSPLLEACPHMQLLVTSRELLSVQGEVECPVLPLAAAEGVELFCARSGLEPNETAEQLCHALEELPLAIELAAARTSVLSPRQILERISQRLDLLKGGRAAEGRQKTLRATVEWSHNLLSIEERRLLARLSVFVGGCTLEAAEGVAEADLDTVQSLVHKSLLRHTEERFWMLETIREYAAERLSESHELETLLEWHATYFLGFSERAEGYLRGPDRASWLDRLEEERENLRAALGWARAVGSVEIELRLATALRDFWLSRGPMSEALRRLGEAVRVAGDRLPDRRADALAAASLIALRIGDAATAEQLAAELLELARKTGNVEKEVSALLGLSGAAADRAMLDRARPLMEEAVATARRAGDARLVGHALLNFADLALKEGDDHRAAELAEQSLREGGAALSGAERAVALTNLALARVRLGHVDQAVESAREAVTISMELGDRALLSWSLETVAATKAGADPTRAAQILGAAHALMEDLGDHGDPDILAAVQAAAGEELYERSHAEGRALTLDDAVNLATERLQAP
jgi:predicted ATPase/class 3 adenylate cyclase